MKKKSSVETIKIVFAKLKCHSNGDRSDNFYRLVITHIHD